MFIGLLPSSKVQFTQMYDLSLNEGMLLCTLLNTPKLTSSEIAEALLSVPTLQKVSFALSRKEAHYPSDRYQGR